MFLIQGYNHTPSSPYIETKYHKEYSAFHWHVEAHISVCNLYKGPFVLAYPYYYKKPYIEYREDNYRQ